MKKYMKIFLVTLLLSQVLAGCLQMDNKTPVSEKERAKSGSELELSPGSESDNQDADIDLAAMSSTMVYAEVYNMMVEPENYLGKTIKMRGQYAGFYDETADQYYHAVIIADAAACCSQGLEFVWSGEHIYPDDYPEEYSEIEVIGIFKLIKEGIYTYYYIDTDMISVLETENFYDAAS